MEYTNLSLKFTIENTDFTVSMAAVERFERIIPRHVHSASSYEIHYILEGNGIAVINGRRYALSPNTLWISGPSIEHEQIPATDDPMVEYCVYLKLKHKKGKAAGKLVSEFERNAFWFGKDTQNICTTMQMIIHELEKSQKGCEIVLSSICCQLLVQVVRNYSSAADTSPFYKTENSIAPFLTIEEAFLYDYRVVTLSNLAMRIGLSTRQTERLLRQYYGSTFLKKRTEARMSAAAMMLQNTSMPIADIAEITGYSSSEDFSHAFSRHFRISASKYRKNYFIKS